MLTLQQNLNDAINLQDAVSQNATWPRARNSFPRAVLRRTERHSNADICELAASRPAAGPSSSLRTTAAARRLVEGLVARGVDTFFGIPGGPACPVFEAI